QDFAQVAARLLLQQNRRCKEPAIEKRHANVEIVQSDIQRRPEILLVEQSPELLAQWIRNSLADHVQRDGKCMAGAHGARQEIERLRKLLLQSVQPLLPLL